MNTEPSPDTPTLPLQNFDHPEAAFRLALVTAPTDPRDSTDEADDAERDGLEVGVFRFLRQGYSFAHPGFTCHEVAEGTGYTMEQTRNALSRLRRGEILAPASETGATRWKLRPQYLNLDLPPGVKRPSRRFFQGREMKPHSTPAPRVRSMAPAPATPPAPVEPSPGPAESGMGIVSDEYLRSILNNLMGIKRLAVGEVDAWLAKRDQWMALTRELIS